MGVGARGGLEQKWLEQSAPHNKNRMCAPQISPIGGRRTGMEDRRCSGCCCSAGPSSQETILQHHLGIILEKPDSPLSIQHQRAHVPRNLMLPGCSQTRPAFGALILSECCFAGQIPQACVGAGEDKMCSWRPDRLTAPSKQ